MTEARCYGLCAISIALILMTLAVTSYGPTIPPSLDPGYEHSFCAENSGCGDATYDIAEYTTRAGHRCVAEWNGEVRRGFRCTWRRP